MRPEGSPRVTAARAWRRQPDDARRGLLQHLPQAQRRVLHLLAPHQPPGPADSGPEARRRATTSPRFKCGSATHSDSTPTPRPARAKSTTASVSGSTWKSSGTSPRPPDKGFRSHRMSRVGAREVSSRSPRKSVRVSEARAASRCEAAMTNTISSENSGLSTSRRLRGVAASLTSATSISPACSAAMGLAVQSRAITSSTPGQPAFNACRCSASSDKRCSTRTPAEGVAPVWPARAIAPPAC